MRRDPEALLLRAAAISAALVVLLNLADGDEVAGGPSLRNVAHVEKPAPASAEANRKRARADWAAHARKRQGRPRSAVAPPATHLVTVTRQASPPPATASQQGSRRSPVRAPAPPVQPTPVEAGQPAPAPIRRSTPAPIRQPSAPRQPAAAPSPGYFDDSG